MCAFDIVLPDTSKLRALHPGNYFIACHGDCVGRPFKLLQARSSMILMQTSRVAALILHQCIAAYKAPKPMVRTAHADDARRWSGTPMGALSCPFVWGRRWLCMCARSDASFPVHSSHNHRVQPTVGQMSIDSRLNRLLGQ